MPLPYHSIPTIDRPFTHTTPPMPFYCHFLPLATPYACGLSPPCSCACTRTHVLFGRFQILSTTVLARYIGGGGRAKVLNSALPALAAGRGPLFFTLAPAEASPGARVVLGARICMSMLSCAAQGAPRGRWQAAEAVSAQS